MNSGRARARATHRCSSTWRVFNAKETFENLENRIFITFTFSSWVAYLERFLRLSNLINQLDDRCYFFSYLENERHSKVKKDFEVK